MSNGLDITLAVAGHVALVLDIHHHWVRTGEYISPQDPRVQRVVDSWRGTRPVIHYSLSREDVLQGHDINEKPDVNKILTEGTSNKSKLRAHSDAAWNRASNLWALEFWNDADIQFEAKFKNIASMQLYEDSKTI